MDESNIKYFVAVARYGSINQAAKAMYISQPQLSHIIRNIEEEAGMELFQRTSQGTRLTRNGEMFLRHCEVIEQEMDNLRRFVAGTREENSRFSVSMTRFSHTAECFNEVCRRHQETPLLRCKLKEDSTTQVIEDLAEARSNVGVIHFSTSNMEIMKKHFEDRNLRYIHLATFGPYVCISANHELVVRKGRNGLDINDLRDYGVVRYIGQYEDFIYHIATQNGLVDLNESQKIIYVNDRQEQMQLISRTNFYTIGISEFDGQDDMYSVISVPLLHTSEHLSFGILTRKNISLSAMENEFIELVSARYRELQAEELQKQ
ncbi:MAG: LysR family transcriptional regulator [Clostridium sp.]|nr:LysR family transcriptional regulator [Clostridium sp.]